LCLIDVAGHGVIAEKRATEILSVLEENYKLNLESLMFCLQRDAMKKRGFVVGMSLVNIATGLIQYMSLGNISCRIFGLQEYRFVSREGVMGVSQIKPIFQSYFLNNNDILMMYTDGISNRFQLSDYPEMLSDDIQAIPNNIATKFTKETDDASCIVMRYHYD